MLIVNCYISYSMVSNRYFKRMLSRVSPTWKCMSKNQLTQYYLPMCIRLVKEATRLELKGRTACLIVDEMSKNGVSFFNIMLSCLVDCECTTRIGVFFWDSVSLSSQSSESFVKAINEMTFQYRVSLIPSSWIPTDKIPTKRESLVRHMNDNSRRWVMSQAITCSSIYDTIWTEHHHNRTTRSSLPQHWRFHSFITWNGFTSSILSPYDINRRIGSHVNSCNDNGFIILE